MGYQQKLTDFAKYIRYLILVSTTEAGSGHPTSSMSAADLMTGLMFGGTFRFDVHRPEHHRTYVLLGDSEMSEGSQWEAIQLAALSTNPVPVHSLAVRKVPRSETTDQLLEFEGISKNAIVQKVHSILKASAVLIGGRKKQCTIKTCTGRPMGQGVSLCG